MNSLSADAYFPTIYQIPNEALEGWHAEVRMGCSRDSHMGGHIPNGMHKQGLQLHPPSKRKSVEVSTPFRWHPFRGQCDEALLTLQHKWKKRPLDESQGKTIHTWLPLLTFSILTMGTPMGCGNPLHFSCFLFRLFVFPFFPSLTMRFTKSSLDEPCIDGFATSFHVHVRQASAKAGHLYPRSWCRLVRRSPYMPFVDLLFTLFGL